MKAVPPNILFFTFTHYSLCIRPFIHMGGLQDVQGVASKGHHQLHHFRRGGGGSLLFFLPLWAFQIVSEWLVGGNWPGVLHLHLNAERFPYFLSRAELNLRPELSSHVLNWSIRAWLCLKPQRLVLKEFLCRYFGGETESPTVAGIKIYEQSGAPILSLSYVQSRLGFYNKDPMAFPWHKKIAGQEHVDGTW